MKKTVLGLLAATAISFGMSGCCTPPRASAWEYRDYKPSGIESLNGVGKTGWIVVSAYYNPDDQAVHYLLKRLRTNP